MSHTTFLIEEIGKGRARRAGRKALCGECCLAGRRGSVSARDRLRLPFTARPPPFVASCPDPFIAIMDNLAHTLAGLAIAEAGLRRKTAFGATTLAIAANLPDIDAGIYFFGDGVDALAFRRGWTHGILAMLVLPLVLALCMRGVSKLRRSSANAPPVNWRWLLTLSAIGVWSHPLLDLLNTYGVRLLMPFSGRWFYGDTLFIIDLWLWLALLIGIVMSRAFHAPRAARMAIALVSVYIVAMAASSRVGRQIVEREAVGDRATRVMVSPEPVTPFRRRVVRDLGDRYEVGDLTLGSSVSYRPTDMIPSGRRTWLAGVAVRTREGAAFLSWSRFPVFVAEEGSHGTLVRISDLRYADERGRGWAAVVVDSSMARWERGGAASHRERP
jgi:inner membrane protein